MSRSFAAAALAMNQVSLDSLPPSAQGALAVVTNYTGDVLNFGMAVEKARAVGKKVEMVIVGDDVGVGRAKSGKVGRRGLSGTALVAKLCSALAAQGADLDECAGVGRLAVANLVSVGASLSRVHVPGRSMEEAKEEEERLGPGLVELGMGIHNEPGCEKLKTDLPGLVKKMLAQLLDPGDTDRAYVKIGKKEDLLLLINNFGGTSNLELGAVTTEICAQLRTDYELRPKRVLTGNFFGSLDGPGFTITILKLVDTGLGSGKSMLELIDAPAEAVGWPVSIKPETWDNDYGETTHEGNEKDEGPQASNLRVNPATMRKALESGLKRVIAAEADVTRFDTIVGDGDCGVGLKRGAEGLLRMLEGDNLSDDAVVNMARVVPIIETTMDGTSGALYAIFLNSLAHHLRQQSGPSPAPTTPDLWAKALSLSLEALEKYTPAQPGDRTLMDALCPFIENLKSSGDTRGAAEAAKKGADSTKGMKPKLGRTVYVGGKGWEDVPDPGAYGLSEFLTGLAEGM
ncbi:dihydroxyacetone kinase [Physcia stellaris]|nr:dihydroxyacetone kinase [Physcia stellaris]